MQSDWMMGSPSFVCMHIWGGLLAGERAVAGHAKSISFKSFEMVRNRWKLYEHYVARVATFFVWFRSFGWDPLFDSEGWSARAEGGQGAGRRRACICVFGSVPKKCATGKNGVKTMQGRRMRAICAVVCFIRFRASGRPEFLSPSGELCVNIVLFYMAVSITIG